MVFSRILRVVPKKLLSYNSNWFRNDWNLQLIYSLLFWSLPVYKYISFRNIFSKAVQINRYFQSYVLYKFNSQKQSLTRIKAMFKLFTIFFAMVNFAIVGLNQSKTESKAEFKKIKASFKFSPVIVNFIIIRYTSICQIGKVGFVWVIFIYTQVSCMSKQQ